MIVRLNFIGAVSNVTIVVWLYRRFKLMRFIFTKIFYVLWAQHEVSKYEDERLTYEMIFGGCMEKRDEGTKLSK